jgi:hypothetical protein
METANGKRVTLRYQCKLTDGTVCHIGEKDTLDLVLGAGSTPPTLESALIGMQPGERKSVQVTAAELKVTPFAEGVQSETPPGIAYDFAPGDGGDVSELLTPRPVKRGRQPLPAGADLYLDFELLKVEEP